MVPGSLDTVLVPVTSALETLTTRPSLLFWVVVGLTAAERLFELWLSNHNLARMRARGGRPVARDGYLALVTLHTLLFPALVVEAVAAPWAGHHILTWPLLALLAGAQGLRYWAIVTLGDRWCTRVVLVPGEGRVRGGPYRFLDHPNYLAVVVELFVLPAAFGLWATAVGATAVNLVALRYRIAREEAALNAAARSVRKRASS